MTFQQGSLFALLLAALVLFAWGRWRYDVVALLVLLAATVAGLVPPDQAFLGFGNPAVVTVAAVLVLSRGLSNAGITALLARFAERAGRGPLAHVALLTTTVTLLSSLMNNVGALALVLPVAVRVARRGGYSPSLLLMPIAFGSLLGGLTTLIGTPANILVSSARAAALGAPFELFDFLPVGGVAAAGGLLYLVIVGWRLIPRRASAASGEPRGGIREYLVELRVPEESKFAGRPLHEVEPLARAGAVAISLLRGDARLSPPPPRTVLRPGDGLLFECAPEALPELLRATGFLLEGERDIEADLDDGEETAMVEGVVTAGSPLVGRTVREVRLRNVHGLNLLAVARQGHRRVGRIADLRFRAGDVLLLQGGSESGLEALRTLRCLPLPEREVRLDARPSLLRAGLTFAAAVTLAATGVLSLPVAFAGAAVIFVLTGTLALREAYDAVDWPVLVLLGSMIPLGSALESTGAAALAADAILRAGRELPAWASLALLMVVTMCLSDVVNNAAVAVLMAPIALGIAGALGHSSDPYLMAVAIGASCAFLTPIGHQSNTLVMGPGGYRFGDYWRPGLPLEAVVLAISVPSLLVVWPP